MDIYRVITILMWFFTVDCFRPKIIEKKKPWDPSKLKLGRRRMCADHYFWDIVRYPTFVDKTLMIQQVFEGPNFISITAPKRFGKSTNLDMLRNFLSVSVDDRGQKDVKAENETLSYFKELAIYKQCQKFFDKHFGQYVVIPLTFNNHEVINTTEAVANVLMTNIHRSYWSHEYICDSRALSQADKQICFMWINSFHFDLLDIDDIVKGLKYLAKFLYKHHKKKIWILIDDYDAIMKQAMFNVNNATALEEIMDFVLTTLGQDGKMDIPSLEKVVMTGNSYMVGISQTTLKNVTHYGFLDDHPYGNYYGFTQPEVDKLFRDERFNLSSEVIEKALKLYDGYISRKSTKIYNPFSVLKFINTRGSVKNYWIRIESLRSLGGDLNKIIEIEDIRELFYRLLKGIPIHVDYVRQLTPEEVIHMSSLIKDNHVNNTQIQNLFFSYLVEVGCFSFVSRNEVSIANREIGNELKLIMDKYEKNEKRKFYAQRAAENKTNEGILS